MAILFIQKYKVTQLLTLLELNAKSISSNFRLNFIFILKLLLIEQYPGCIRTSPFFISY